MTPSSQRLIESSSPGKLVISGEYAVLYGAPALSMAVNRRVDCRLLSRQVDGWQFTSEPEFWNEIQPIDRLLADGDDFEPASMVQWFSQFAPPPSRLEIHTKSTKFFQSEKKLGIGSSAAVMVAFSYALARFMNVKFGINELFMLYDAVKQTGSGIDVATSFHGGVIAFEERVVNAVSLPAGLCCQVFYVGESSATAAMIVQFRKWFDTQPHRIQHEYLTVTQNVVTAVGRLDSFLSCLHDFITVQKNLDRTGKLGIWSAKHQEIARRAAKLGIIYKPSGAGGGDVGIALAVEVEPLRLLAHQAHELNCSVIALNVEKDGVRIDQDI